MSKIVWEAATVGLPPRLEIVRSHVVAQPDRTIRACMHASASVWVGRRGRDYLVLQCARVIDQHRVLATCSSSTAAYLLRGQIEALQRLATEKGENTSGARRMAHAAGVLLPKK